MALYNPGSVYQKLKRRIAQVKLKVLRILVLGEATSSLDSRSEALIQEALKLLARRGLLG